MAHKGATELIYQERQQIEELLKLGYTIGGVASVIGRSHSCVKQEILKNGKKENYNAEVGQKAANIRKLAKSAKIRKNITDEQEKIIREGVANGLSLNKLRELTGISNWKLSCYVKEHAIKYRSKSYLGFENRITNLEYQIEIIIDQIKELKK